MTRDQAWQLLCEYTLNPSLRKHALAVEASMEFYAKLLHFDPLPWALAGLLHDFDYERWPNPPDHTREGAKILRHLGVDEEVIGAILAHAEWNLDEYPRDRPIRKALFAVDELSGFLVACALVRPERLTGMKAQSVLKKMKTASFAAAVSRDDILKGAALLGLDVNEHIENCIEALRNRATAIDLG